MDEPLFLEDWVLPDPPDEEYNWTLNFEDPFPPFDGDSISEPLLLAIEANNLREVQALLASGLSPNLRDDLMPMLSIACRIGATEISRALLAAGADPNLKYDDGLTPLYFATQAGHFEIVQDLVKAGANPTDGFYGGVSSISEGEKRKIFEYLLDFVSDEDLLLCLSEEDLKSILSYEFYEQPCGEEFDQTLAAEKLYYFLVQETSSELEQIDS